MGNRKANYLQFKFINYLGKACTQSDLSMVVGFTPQPLRALWVLFSLMASGWLGGRGEKACPGCISETMKCRMLILARGIRWGGCRCVMSWFDLDLTFDHSVVTLSFNILFGPCLRNCKVFEVDSWMSH